MQDSIRSRLLALIGRNSLVVSTIGILAGAFLTLGSAYAGFTAITGSPGNSWATGTVLLSNDSNGSSQAQTGNAVFTSGQSASFHPYAAGVTECITVRSTGSLGSTVKLYATGASNTNSLMTYLDVTIDVGTATSTSGGACTGFSADSTVLPTTTLASFTATNSSYANGVATGWSPAGGSTEDKVFRIKIVPRNDMTNLQQSSTADVTFNWQANNG